MMMKTMKKLVWIGDSLKQLRQFPDEVKDSVGYALYQIQNGEVPRRAKPLRGLKPAVMELVSHYDTDTYRTVYTVKIDEMLYVLHCFQKKSKRAVKTPKQEVLLIKQRLYEAKTLSQGKR